MCVPQSVIEEPEARRTQHFAAGSDRDLDRVSVFDDRGVVAMKPDQDVFELIISDQASYDRHDDSTTNLVKIARIKIPCHQAEPRGLRAKLDHS